jgi:hypothetical protein
LLPGELSLGLLVRFSKLSAEVGLLLDFCELLLRFKAVPELMGAWRLKAAAKEAGWKGKQPAAEAAETVLVPWLPLWSEAAEVGGGNGGDFLEAAIARSRSSAKALSRGEISIIGEDDEAVEAVDESGEVGGPALMLKLSLLFNEDMNMACWSNMAGRTLEQTFAIVFEFKIQNRSLRYVQMLQLWLYRRRAL